MISCLIGLKKTEVKTQNNDRTKTISPVSSCKIIDNEGSSEEIPNLC